MVRVKEFTIQSGEMAYMWVVHNVTANGIWVLYDGENAHEFAEEARKAGDEVYCIQTPIADMEE